MRAKKNGVPLDHGPKRKLSDPAIDQRGARGGRSVALVITALAILMMVAM